MGSSFLPAIGALERLGVASPDNAWSLEPLEPLPPLVAPDPHAPDADELTPPHLELAELSDPRAA
jgi:hypothetical protein